ncbi:hypothetical protein WJX73_000245 [Symbiochloris irregularis]|uniref:Amidohydrolase-related domain-containing protein n=1 Tax=Symbiochloris irregularis TaxID=706552 RepID=A0AAW1PEF2_9CHLO
MPTKLAALRGDVVSCPDFGSVEIASDHLILAEASEQGGRILAIAPGEREAGVLAKHGLQAGDVQRLKAGQYILPGFVDLHVHAPQYSYGGTATDRPLMEWLEVYTFPREGLHEDEAIALAQGLQLARRLVDNGTTCALFFGSLHLSGCKALATAMHQVGMRALVGLTAMDRNSPDNYCKSAAANIADLRKFIQFIRQLDTDLLEPVITPRFIPTCSKELLQGLGEVAAEAGVPVQSHISESLDEVAFAEHLHPEVNGRDTPLFDEAGLLTQRCVMAHAVWLEDDELRVLADRGSAIAHCPLSNFFFADKLLRVKHCRSLGVKVGLGTDIAGGYSPSMLNAMRNAVIASKALRMQAIIHKHSKGQEPKAKDREAEIDIDADLIGWKEALWLATQGGAEALGLQDSIGQLQVGKQLDALLVDCTKADTFDIYPADTSLDRLEKFATVGDDRNISGVWIKGRRVK